MSRGWESVQGASRGVRGKGCGGRLQMPGAQVLGKEDVGGGHVPPTSATAPHPILAGSKLPWRPLTPGQRNFQGMFRISGSSGRHLKEERQEERSRSLLQQGCKGEGLPPAGSAQNCRGVL